MNSTVTTIAMLFTAGSIVLQRPEPFYALLSGAGFGALGAGIITIALNRIKRIDALADLAIIDPRSSTISALDPKVRAGSRKSAQRAIAHPFNNRRRRFDGSMPRRRLVFRSPLRWTASRS